MFRSTVFGRIGCAFMILASGGSLAVRAADSKVSLETAIKAIRAQEEAVQFISVDSVWRASRWNEDKLKMDPDGEAEVSTIFERANGRIRMDVHRQLLPWTNGPAPFELTSYVVTYDGRIGVHYTSKHGDFTSPKSTSEGEIGGRRPDLLTLNYAGWRSTIFGFTESSNFDGQRFATLLETPGAKIEQLEVTENGKQFLQVTRIAEFPAVRKGMGKHVFWFDPEHNYAIARIIEYRATLNESRTKLIYTDTVGADQRITGYWEVAPGISYPKRVDLVNFEKHKNGNRERDFESVTEISKVTVNDPKIDDRTFQFIFPKGTQVVDTVSNKYFTIQGTPQEQQKLIESAVLGARAMNPATATQPLKP